MEDLRWECNLFKTEKETWRGEWPLEGEMEVIRKASLSMGVGGEVCAEERQEDAG